MGCILFGPGPTLKSFLGYNIIEKIDKDYLKIGVNGTIIHKEIRSILDYYIWGGDIDIPQHPTPSEKPIINAIKQMSKEIPKYASCYVNGGLIFPQIGCRTQI